jgi:hypothetical protein
MKKASLFIVALFLGIAIQGFSQAPTAAIPTDFYLGKWKVTILGTPQGDASMDVTFSMKDGKLIGDMQDLEDPSKTKPLTAVELDPAKVTIFFSAAGYDLSIPFEKVDDDNLKGKMMDMFDCTAKRVK